MTPLTAAIRDYLSACQLRRLSPRTITLYRNELTVLTNALGDSDVATVTPAELRAYFANVSARNVRWEGHPHHPEMAGELSAGTIRNRIMICRAFFGWANEEYQLGRNPMLHIDPPRKPQKTRPKAMEPDDFRKLLKACFFNLTGRRDHALLCFLADTGCRIGGALGLTMDRLFVNQLQAVLIEKGQRVRAVPFSAEMADLLRHWLVVRPTVTDAVFCSVAHRNYGQAMSVNGWSTSLKVLRLKAGVTGRSNPHSLRHAFALSILKQGGNLITLSQILGHSSVATTAIYSQFSESELADFHRQFSPLRLLQSETDERIG